MPRDNRCMYMAHVCFLCLLLVTEWGSVGNVCFCSGPLLKIVFFLALEC